VEEVLAMLSQLKAEPSMMAASRTSSFMKKPSLDLEEDYLMRQGTTQVLLNPQGELSEKENMDAYLLDERDDIPYASQ